MECEDDDRCGPPGPPPPPPTPVIAFGCDRLFTEDMCNGATDGELIVVTSEWRSSS